MSKQKHAWFAPTPWDGQKGFWPALNRFFYQIEGPAQLGGAVDEPSYRPPQDAVCPVCGRPMAAHRIERGGPGEKTFLHCPA